MTALPRSFANILIFINKMPDGSVVDLSDIMEKRGILANAPRFGEKDRLLTIIVNGDGAWEHFTKVYDAKEFFRRFYGKLQDSYTSGEIVTVTPSEYIDGNPKRS